MNLVMVVPMGIFRNPMDPAPLTELELFRQATIAKNNKKNKDMGFANRFLLKSDGPVQKNNAEVIRCIVFIKTV